jgi:hypothetical protein
MLADAWNAGTTTEILRTESAVRTNPGSFCATARHDPPVNEPRVERLDQSGSTGPMIDSA